MRVLSAYADPEKQKEIITIGKTFAEYAHDQGVGVLLYPDNSARLLDQAVQGYWEHAYPGERMPERYFINPQTAGSKEQTLKSLRDKIHFFAPTKPIPDAFSPEQADTLTPTSIFAAYAAATDLQKVLPEAALQDIMDLADFPDAPPFPIRLGQYLLKKGARYEQVIAALTPDIANSIEDLLLKSSWQCSTNLIQDS